MRTIGDMKGIDRPGVSAGGRLSALRPGPVGRAELDPGRLTAADLVDLQGHGAVEGRDTVAVLVVVERRRGGESHLVALGNRILVGGEEHELPGARGLLVPD